MNKRISRVLSSIFIVMLLITSIPIDVFAEAITGSEDDKGLSALTLYNTYNAKGIKILNGIQVEDTDTSCNTVVPTEDYKLSAIDSLITPDYLQNYLKQIGCYNTVKNATTIEDGDKLVDIILMSEPAKVEFNTVVPGWARGIPGIGAVAGAASSAELIVRKSTADLTFFGNTYKDGEHDACMNAVIRISSKTEPDKYNYYLVMYCYKGATMSAALKEENSTGYYKYSYDITSIVQNWAATQGLRNVIKKKLASYESDRTAETSNNLRTLQKKLMKDGTKDSTVAIENNFRYVYKVTMAENKSPAWLTVLDGRGLLAQDMLIGALKKSNLYKEGTDYDPVMLPNTNLDNISYVTGGMGGIQATTLDLATNANAIASAYENKSAEYSEVSTISNAVMYSDIVKYQYALAAGAQPKTETSTAADCRVTSEKLDKIIPTLSDATNLVINPKLFNQVYGANFKLPDTNINKAELLRLLISTQMLEDFASVKYTNSGLTDKNTQIKNYPLEEYLSECEGKEKSEQPVLNDSAIVRQVRAYKSIKEGLDYSGLKPWTTNLEYIYNMYGKIKDLNISEDLMDYDLNSETEPLKRFFTMADKTISKNYLNGVALSATYIPMQTNLYDPNSIRILKDKSWLKDFHIKYGFHRKALMLDTNVNAATDRYVTGGKSDQRICTLKDLLEYKKDIVLYVDDNFYNTKQIAEDTDKAYSRLANTEQSSTTDENMTSVFENLFNSSIEDILKTGPKAKYSKTTINDTIEYGNKDKWLDFTKLRETLFSNGIILKDDEIKSSLDSRDYTPMQSYAVVSGIYRDKTLVSQLNLIAKDPAPVFISSPKLYNVNNITETEFNTVYNYAMLKNIEASIGVDYKASTDMENPVYIDIYGNILTESGLVVIPAASNATLYPKEKYTLYTLGFLDLYNNGNYIDKVTDNTDKFWDETADMFYDEEKEAYLPHNYEFNGVPINPMHPSIADNGLLNILFDTQSNILNNAGYDFDQRIWLITEVLRGAPIESINKEQEGLIGNREKSKYGMAMSAKLDDISSWLTSKSGDNSIIAMPNIAFEPIISYVVVMMAKIMLVVFLFYIMARIYLDAIAGRIGLSTLWECITTILIFCILTYSIPGMINLSYNQTNKVLLQNEVKYINLLTTEKRAEGREISAYGVTEPQSTSQMYIKIDSVKVPWYKLMDKLLFTDLTTDVKKMYDEELSNNYMYGMNGIEVKNGGMYISVNSIFDSSSVIYNNNHKFLYQNINETPTASYVLPYYYMMDTILASTNNYNKSNDILSITTKIQSDGSVKTMGMIKDYLTSAEFMEEQPDPLGLYSIYGIHTNLATNTYVEEDDEESLKKSMWYVKANYEDDDIKYKIDQVYTHMRAYVANNMDMIGRVSDETFLKCMILDSAITYNNQFRIPAAKSIEISNVDSRDLIRLGISEKGVALYNTSQSFGKFVYEQGGSGGVILAGILMALYFVVGFINPILIIFIIGLLIYGLIIKSMFDRNRGKAIEGALITLSILILVNTVHALSMKASMVLPLLGLNTNICLIVHILIQGLYLFLVMAVTDAIFKDMGSIGYNVYQAGIQSITNGILGSSANKLRRIGPYTQEQRMYMDIAERNQERNPKRRSTNTPEELDNELRRRDIERDTSTEEQAFMDYVFKSNDNKNTKHK